MPKTKTKTVVLDVETDERLVKLSDMDDTRDSVVQKLLGEKWHIEKLKNTLTVAIEKNEAAKKSSARHGLAVEAANALIQVLSEFVKAVESR